MSWGDENQRLLALQKRDSKILIGFLVVCFVIILAILGSAFIE